MNSTVSCGINKFYLLT